MVDQWAESVAAIKPALYYFPTSHSFLPCSLFLVFPARAPSNFTAISPAELAQYQMLGISEGQGRHAGMQAGFQLALLVTTLAMSIVGGLLTGKGSSDTKTRVTSGGNGRM